VIRLATGDDVEAIREVERRAGELFRDIGMPEVADEPPPTAELVARIVDEGRAWVVERRGAVVAFAVVRQIESTAHLVQLSVDPGHAHKGLGASLIDEIERWGAERGLMSVTLTTFTTIPWNAPYYERLGFEPMAPHQLRWELAADLDRERARFDAPRVAMVRAIRPTRR
jgi:GNAT superfamily N-acetyltransferase